MANRRATGAYYTPRPIARLVTALALRRCLAGSGMGDPAILDSLLPLPLAIDPAAGQANGPPASDAARPDAQAANAIPLPEQRVGSTLPNLALAQAAALLQGARVFDPAVGEGVFLLAIIEALMPAIRAVDAAEPVTGIRRFAASALYGMDVDPNAVAHTLSAVHRMLATTASEDAMLAKHIRTGNTLFDPPIAEHEGGRFDLVIGNPPWGARLTAEEKRTLRQRHNIVGSADSFVLFVLRGLELLADRGVFAMVLPDILLLKDYSALRSRLLSQLQITDLAQLGPRFGGVSIDPVALIGRREPDRDRRMANVVSTWRFLAGDAGLLPLPAIAQSELVGSEGHRFNIHLTEDDRRLQRKMAGAGRPLGEILDAHEGIHSGNIRPKLFVMPPAPPDAAPLLFGRDEVVPYAIRWAGCTVRYDRALIDRNAGEYANLGRQAWFAPPKLVIRRTGDFLLAAVDTAGYYCSNNLFVARPRPEGAEDPADLYYLLALLNAKPLTWYYRSLQPRVGRPFAELKLHHLRRLPIVWPSREERHALSLLAAEICRIEGRPAPGEEAEDRRRHSVRAAGRERPSARHPSAEIARKQSLLRTIDREVANLYRLAPPDRALVGFGGA